jgi:hypothetical protein
LAFFVGDVEITVKVEEKICSEKYSAIIGSD